jgi:hypothetical protein
MTTIKLEEFAQGLRDTISWGEAEELTRKTLGKDLKVHELWDTLRCDFRELAEDLCRQAGYEVGPDYATKPAAIDLKALAKQCENTTTYELFAQLVNEHLGTRVGTDEVRLKHQKHTANISSTVEQDYMATLELIARENGFSVVNGEATKHDATAREALDTPDEDTGPESCDDPECPDHDSKEDLADHPTVIELRRQLADALHEVGRAQSHEKSAKEALEWEQRSSADRGALAEQLSAQVAELTDQRDELINEREGLIAKNQQLLARQGTFDDLRGRLVEALEKLQSQTLRSASLERQLDVVKAEREVEQARERLKHAEMQLANRKASLHVLRATPGVQHDVKARYDHQSGHWVALEDSTPATSRTISGVVDLTDATPTYADCVIDEAHKPVIRCYYAGRSAPKNWRKIVGEGPNGSAAYADYINQLNALNQAGRPDPAGSESGATPDPVG